MPRYRIKFSKDDRARFISHLDLMHTFERAIRRAGLSVAFSQGFNPHPRISFAAPLPVGISGIEYLDVDLVKHIPVEQVLQRLVKSLPQGLIAHRVWQVPDQAPSLMAMVKRATYRVELEVQQEDLTGDALAEYIRSFMSLPEITVLREVKDKGVKKRDIRPGILSLTGYMEDKKVVLEMELRAGSAGNVRPDEVIKVFVQQIPAVFGEPRVIRTGVYPVE